MFSCLGGCLLGWVVQAAHSMLLPRLQSTHSQKLTVHACITLLLQWQSLFLATEGCTFLPCGELSWPGSYTVEMKQTCCSKSSKNLILRDCPLDKCLIPKQLINFRITYKELYNVFPSQVNVISCKNKGIAANKNRAWESVFLNFHWCLFLKSWNWNWIQVLNKYPSDIFHITESNMFSLFFCNIKSNHGHSFRCWWLHVSL